MISKKNIMEQNLWNKIEDIPNYEENIDLYQDHILEQYKLYVEMADRVSTRRNLTNVFFLSLNTLWFSIIGFIFEKLSVFNPKWLFLFPIISIIILCIIWWWLIKSYRDLNTAKYRTIGRLEQKLPSSPYWSAEWNELVNDKFFKKYLSLTTLENIVPILFGLMHLLLGIYVIILK